MSNDLKPLAAEGIAAGMLITVLQAKDASGKGDVFRVLEVQLPYIATEALTGTWADRMVTWDTRETTFAEVSKAYLDALTPEPDTDNAVPTEALLQRDAHAV